MSLHDDPLVAQIKHNIASELDKISGNLASGGVSTFEEYKHQCGRIKGLKQALICIDDAIDMYLNDEDEDD